MLLTSIVNIYFFFMLSSLSHNSVLDVPFLKYNRKRNKGSWLTLGHDFQLPQSAVWLTYSTIPWLFEANGNKIYGRVIIYVINTYTPSYRGGPNALESYSSLSGDVFAIAFSQLPANNLEVVDICSRFYIFLSLFKYAMFYLRLYIFSPFMGII